MCLKEHPLPEIVHDCDTDLNLKHPLFTLPGHTMTLDCTLKKKPTIVLFKLLNHSQSCFRLDSKK